MNVHLIRENENQMMVLISTCIGINRSVHGVHTVIPHTVYVFLINNKAT